MIPAALTAAAQTAGPQPRPGGVIIDAARPGQVTVDGRVLINLASCDYLGFAHDQRITQAAHDALREWGLGMAATRVLSGTTAVHRELERQLAAWVGCDDAVLHGSCWAANAAVFGTLTTLAGQAGAHLVIYSDQLNHASIIDGIRAHRGSAATLRIYPHDAPGTLRHQLEQDHDRAGPMVAVIVTDGVFSMEGDQAPLTTLAQLAGQHSALLVVDDSHGTGVAGATGRGTAQAQNLLGAVDVITGTLGKALGGASGGFVAGPRNLMAALRAMSRPYIFSNNPPVLVAAAALAALDVLRTDRTPLQTLRARVTQLRDGITEQGLPSHPGQHPIVPIIIGDETATVQMSRTFHDHGLLATPLAFPIVPRGQARLRIQISAAHPAETIEKILHILRLTATTRR
jgi:glycine C-acetyltransferase